MRDPRAALTDTLLRIEACLRMAGRTRDDELKVNELARETGIPPADVAALLDHQEVPEEEFSDRLRNRILHLRETRRRPDGTAFSLSEIGESFGSSGAAISAIIKGKGKNGPLAATSAGIEKFFFGSPNGFLSAEAVPALNAALQPVLKRLEHETDPLAKMVSGHRDVRGVALRQARDLPEGQWKVLHATLEALLKVDDEDEK